MKIKQKITSTIVLLVLVPSIFIGVIAYSEAKNRLTSESEAKNNFLEFQVSDNANVYTDLADAFHKFAGDNIDINFNVAVNKFNEYCGTYVEIGENETLVCETGERINDALYDNSLVTDIRNTVRGHSSIFINKNDGTTKKISTTVTSGLYAYGYIGEEEMYKKAIEEASLYSEYTKIDGIYKTKKCQPFFGSDGLPSAILCVGLNETNAAESVLEKMSEVKFGNNGHLFVLGNIEKINKGKYVYHKDYTGEDSAEHVYSSAIYQNLNGMIRYNINGVEKIASFKYFEPYDWIIVAEQSVSSSKGSIAQVRNTIIISSIIFLILAFITGMIASSRISNPIKELSAAGNKIAEGDIEASLPEIKTKDEIKDLSDTMEVLVGAIRFYKKGNKK